MNIIQIFEPAMCCSTGVCGVGVDPELLRISTLINTLEKRYIKIDRFNLSSSPQAFIKNKTINDFIKEHNGDKLPATILNGEIILTGRYPSNEEIIQYLDIPSSDLIEENKAIKDADNESEGCCCSDGNCC